MPILNGYGGSVKIGSTTIANLDSWSLSIDVNASDITSFGNSWKLNQPTQKSWSAKASGQLDPGDTLGQIALQNAILGGQLVTVAFSTGSSDNKTYNGQAIAKMDVKADVKDVVQVDFSFEGAGPLNYS